MAALRVTAEVAARRNEDLARGMRCVCLYMHIFEFTRYVHACAYGFVSVIAGWCF